jgi:antirestriction protein ArdC
MLLMQCERKGYTLPVFLTYNKCLSLNFSDSPQGRVPAVDAKGEKLPWVHVLKGEKSFPVFLTTFTVVGENGEKMKYDDYKLLSDTEKAKYRVFPSTIVYDVFNVAQTNIEEARPDLFNKMKADLIPSRPAVETDGFEFKAFDLMTTNNKWICPINVRRQDRAYYSPSKNEIVLPEKSQFQNGQSFYSTAFHECIHSTGAADHLNRLQPSVVFGSPVYAREELVAELGAALTAHRYGFGAHIKEESAAYLKSWLKSLKEEPSFIKTTLLDVKRATSMLTQCLDALGAEVARTDEPAQAKEDVGNASLKQFKELKAKHPDALLLFRVGDFYVAYSQDAKDASEILGVTLTKTGRRKMTMFPFHALDIYLPKLIRAGRRVAICDQINEAA